MLKSVDLRAIRSEGPSRDDLFQWGPQSMDLRESFCRIKRPEGQESCRHTFFTCQKLALILRQVFKINSLMQNILCDNVRGFGTNPSRCLKRERSKIMGTTQAGELYLYG